MSGDEQETIQNLFQEAFKDEQCYKNQELEEIEMKIIQTKCALQTLRQCLLCQEKENPDTNHQSWSQFESQFHNSDREHEVNEKKIVNGSCDKKWNETRIVEKRGKAIEDNNDTTGSDGSRFYIEHSVIVGNTSQYLKRLTHSTTDKVTHKWMTYVRSTMNQPPLESYVKSVTFLLHPTYAPNDIITVTRPPFQLTRLGWGEFPVRVQLQFHDPLNKPVDILHPLKLDQTHSGEQLLGAETCVNIQLVRNQYDWKLPSLNDSSAPISPSLSSVLPSSLSSPARSLSPSYSPARSLSPVRLLSPTHSPARSLSPSYSPARSLSPVRLLSPSHSPARSLSPVRLLSPSHSPPFFPISWSPTLSPPLSSPSPYPLHTPSLSSPPPPPSPLYVTVPITKASDTVLLEHDYHKQTLVRMKDDVPRPKPRPLPISSYDDILLHTTVRLFGLYNSSHSFSAPSLANYYNWNVSKQRGNEWMRAIAVKDHLCQSGLHSLTTTRQIVIWCRAHGYTPLRTGQNFCKVCGYQLKGKLHNSCLIPTNMNSVSESCDLIERLSQLNDPLTECDNIDVMSLSVSNRSLVSLDDVIHRIPKFPELRWVNRAANEVGVVLCPVSYDKMLLHVIDHMIFSACSQFLCQLLRKAVAMETEGSAMERIVVPLHLYRAIQVTPDFDFLTEFGLGLSSIYNYNNV